MERDRLQTSMHQLPPTLAKQLLSLQPDDDAIAGAIGLIEYALLRNLRGEDLGLSGSRADCSQRPSPGRVHQAIRRSKKRGLSPGLGTSSTPRKGHSDCAWRERWRTMFTVCLRIS